MEELINFFEKQEDKMNEYDELDVEDIAGTVTVHESTQHSGSGGVSEYFWVVEGKVKATQTGKSDNGFVETIYYELEAISKTAVVKYVCKDGQKKNEYVYRLYNRDKL